MEEYGDMSLRSTKSNFFVYAIRWKEQHFPRLVIVNLIDVLLPYVE
jgi:hypothetical protein